MQEISNREFDIMLQKIIHDKPCRLPIDPSEGLGVIRGMYWPPNEEEIRAWRKNTRPLDEPIS